MKNFNEIGLPEELQQALAKLKFTTPTAVQAAALPPFQKGKDLIVRAETGSGKTAAYAIPLVEHLLKNPKATALILSPTRELAQQIATFVRDLTAFCEKMGVVPLVGGTDIRRQMRALKKRPRIVVATPGRLTDHLERRTVYLKNVSTLVLDEGDRMLDMGFAPQLEEILQFLPQQRQTSLFTATLDSKVKKLASKYLSQPEEVLVGEDSKPVEKIKQTVVQVETRKKDDRIVDELNARKGSVIVFARTKRRTDSLAKNLESYGFDVDVIHGGRTQGQRNRALQNFRNGKSRILCATDVAARGIDVPQVEHVINFDLPVQDEDYVHRIGRTARNGAEGEAVSFVAPEERRTWLFLARKYQIPGVEIEADRSGPSGRKKKPNQRPRRFADSGPSRSRTRVSTRSRKSDRDEKNEGNGWDKKRRNRPDREGKSENSSWDKKRRSRPDREGKSENSSWDKKRRSRPDREGKNENNRWDKKRRNHDERGKKRDDASSEGKKTRKLKWKSPNTKAKTSTSNWTLGDADRPLKRRKPTKPTAKKKPRNKAQRRFA